MKRFYLCTVLMIAVVLAGCEHDHFVVEVKPDGQSFRRKLTCWHVSGEGGKDIRPLASEKLARIGKLYDKREKIDGGKKHVFTGSFDDTTPADVGGAGSYTHLTSPLGSASAYIERFRGNDDLEASLAKRRAAADKLTDLAIGWFESELSQEPNFYRLKRFLDENLRQDLKNLAICGWTAEAVGGFKPDTQAEFLLRVGHYLYERGYLSPKDVPGLARAVWWGDDPAPLLEHVQRLVAGKMGVAAEEPLPDSLALLSDPQRLEASWSKYVQTTDLFKRRLEKWEEEKKSNPDASKPTPEDLLVDLVGELVFKLRLFEEDDVVELKLLTGQEPYATNGQWDDQADAVNWSSTMRPDAPLPVFCFALWSRPDRGFQQARFGKVLLDGEDLAQYVLWYRGLEAKEAKEWDGFIAGCKPGADLRAAVEAFRFSNDPKPDPEKPDPGKPDEKPASLADIPRGLILDAIGPDDAIEPDAENGPQPPQEI